METSKKKQLLNAQKVDGAIISEENRYHRLPQGITMERYRGYLRTALRGDTGQNGMLWRVSTSSLTSVRARRSSRKSSRPTMPGAPPSASVQVNYTFSRDRQAGHAVYLKVEHKELIAGFKIIDVEC